MGGERRHAPGRRWRRGAGGTRRWSWPSAAAVRAAAAAPGRASSRRARPAGRPRRRPPTASSGASAARAASRSSPAQSTSSIGGGGRPERRGLDHGHAELDGAPRASRRARRRPPPPAGPGSTGAEPKTTSPSRAGPEVEPGGDAEVAATAPDGEEQLGVLVGGGPDDPAVGGHQLHADELVDDEADRAREPAHPGPDGVAAHPDGPGVARAEGEPVRRERVGDGAPRRSRADADDAVVTDVDRVEGRPGRAADRPAAGSRRRARHCGRPPRGPRRPPSARAAPTSCGRRRPDEDVRRRGWSDAAGRRGVTGVAGESAAARTGWTGAARESACHRGVLGRSETG